MYLGNTDDPISSPDHTAHKDTRTRERLLRTVHDAFPVVRPKISTAAVRVEQGGGDHRLLILDEQLAFRFPRDGQHDLDLELLVLDQLRQATTISVPGYEYVAPKRDFGGYRLIAGVPVTLTRLRHIAPASRLAIVDGIVALLKALHGIDPASIRLPVEWPRLWSAAQFAKRLVQDRLSLIVGRWPSLGKPVLRFAECYGKQRAPREVVLHGDLVDEHVLIDERAGQLAGVIDFGDVALGDPAQDFIGFWAYGRRAAEGAIRHYDSNGADPGLPERSRNHFLRYRIDQLYEAVRDGAAGTVLDQQAIAVERLLRTRSNTR
ncbi:phosphotransferase family protein [uncultured Sphingomonas sp.]|uniref:phosphotransferase family protein n=1 Tax=uncultured Sphingomonas sp. TaxID=158754 RepID=UPI0035C9F691